MLCLVSLIIEEYRMLFHFKQFLSPPLFPDDPDKTAVAKVINAVSLFILVMLFFTGSFLVILSGDLNSELFWIVGYFLGLLGVKVLIEKGHTNKASWLILIMLWTIGMLTFLNSGGVQAPGYSLLIIVVSLAGILLGWRVALSIALLSGVVGLLFIGMAVQGILPESSLPDNEFRVWLLHLTTMVVVVMLLRYGIGSIRKALNRAQHELKERRLSEDRFAKIFRANPNALLISELESGIILDVNDTFENLSGYQKERVIGKTATELDVYGDKRGRRVWVEDVKKFGFIYDLEMPLQRKNGEIRTCLLSSEAIEIEGKPCAIVFVQDITERKQAEIDKEMLIQELERRNAELERFAYTVSHDLKSPLVTIGGFLGFLEKDAESGNLEQLRTDINSIRIAADKMRLLLDELLELSRIGRLINPPEPVSFNEIVQDALTITQGQIGTCEVDITITEFPIVIGDRMRLVEVVQNLVDNAAKFMGDQAHPRIIIGMRNDDVTPVFSCRIMALALCRNTRTIFSIYSINWI